MNLRFTRSCSLLILLALFTSVGMQPLLGADSSAKEDPYPGRHGVEIRWLNDVEPIKHALTHVPWRQNCELRYSKGMIGFVLKSQINEKGKWVDPTITLLGSGLINPVEDPELDACLLKQVRKLERLDVSAGFAPGYEGEGQVTYQYFMPYPR